MHNLYSMKILIATRNRSKFTVTSELLRAMLLDTTFVPLYESALEGDVDEQGSIENRAKQKAEFFIQNLSAEEDFNAVLGIDDGFQVGDDEPTPNSKEITDDILAGKWPVGTPVLVLRAHALARKDGTCRVVTIKLPCVFMGNPDGVVREEGIYPLEKVLAPEGMQLPWSQMPKEPLAKFMLDHSRETLATLFT